MISRRQLVLGAAAAGVLVACRGPAGSDGEQPGAGDNLGFAGTLLAAPLPKPAVTFTDTTGQPFDLRAATAGQLSLLFFGYTNCPDVCPVHLGIIASALQQLEGIAPKPIVLFVGVDTARDTPERMRAYLGNFDPDFVGLTATPELIGAAQEDLGLARSVTGEPDTSGKYTVGHPSQILAFTADDLCHIVYPFGTRQQDWVSDLPRLATFDWASVPR